MNIAARRSKFYTKYWVANVLFTINLYRGSILQDIVALVALKFMEIQKTLRCSMIYYQRILRAIHRYLDDILTNVLDDNFWWYMYSSELKDFTLKSPFYEVR